MGMPSIDAITDIAIVATDRPEDVPADYYCISETVEGNYGGVNAGGYFNFNKRSGPFIAFKRSNAPLRGDERPRPPITNIAIRDVDDYLRSNPHLHAAAATDSAASATRPSTAGTATTTKGGRTSMIGNFRKRLSGKPNRGDLATAQSADDGAASRSIPPPKRSRNGARWELVAGNLNRGSLGHSLQIWVQRDIESDPVIDLVVINQSKEELIPFGFAQTVNVDDAEGRPLSLNEGAGHRDRLCLCFKTRTLGHFQNKHAQWFRPNVVDRYPLEDHAEFALTDNVAPFCFPRGMDIVGGRRRRKSQRNRDRKRKRKRHSVHRRSGAQLDLHSILMDKEAQNGADNAASVEAADPSLDDMDRLKCKEDDDDDDGGSITTDSESVSDDEENGLIAGDERVDGQRLLQIHGSEQHTFVLSTELGAKIYGVCIRFYEEQTVDVKCLWRSHSVLHSNF